MNTAALSRYANAGQPIGHAGPDAPIHADERIALADLPRLADSPRAELLQRELDGMRRLGALLADELEAAARELARLDPENPRVNAARRVVALARIG